ncbi:MAG: hypothetical protein ACE5HX_00895 [bacterium]
MKTNIMKISTLCSMWLIGLIGISPLFAQKLVTREGEVKYISKQSYYINLGSGQGLSLGDTVIVKQKNRTIGLLLVQHVAKLSSSCSLLSQNKTIKQGDRVEVLVRIKNKAKSKLETPSVQKNRKLKSISKTPQQYRRSSGRNKRRSINRIKGRFGIQSLWFDDRGSSKLDYNQLALRTKLKVEQFLGLALELRLRWRSRVHNRERALSNNISDNEWTHFVYEFALIYNQEDAPFEFGVGRILSQRIRGLGYIDGGLFSVKMNRQWRIGLAGGTQPSLRGSDFQTNEEKFGVFLSYEKGEFHTQRFSSTVAFSGRYHEGEVSREFIYLQNNFWKESILSIYQSVEFDLNRGWKNSHGENSLQLSNFYFSTRYSPIESLSLTLSYDARKNVRIFETRSIPDSLFDETTRQGYHAGITMRLPYRMRLSGNFGMRFRKGDLKNTVSASGALNVRNIFNTWVTFNARFSYFSTMFTKGYRPNINIRIPISRRLSLYLGGGSYIYQTGSRSTQSHWLEMEGYYRINRWWYANLGYRTFFDDRLKSRRFFAETGVAF